MKKTMTIFILVMVVGLFMLPAAALAKAQVTCPVMGNKINKQIYADHDGKRVYFCCAACLAPFKENPAVYIKKLEDAGIVLEKAPAADKKEEQKTEPHAGHNH